ncbi:MAG: hypothetical protein PQJ50_12765 [Spirochaetales bacterium]|nr:hypothetical protein [Spirochaetales bacterium]
MPNEISFYPEICEKFSFFLKGLLGSNYLISYSMNKTLPQMILEIEQDLGSDSLLSEDYIPNLKLDILFGVKAKENNRIEFILFEVKYLKQVSLIEYSQMLGYLTVGKGIKTGLLFLVSKSRSSSPVSSELQDIIATGNLPMEFSVKKNDILHSYHTGLCYYYPGNGINWFNTDPTSGIKSFEHLKTRIIDLLK